MRKMGGGRGWEAEGKGHQGLRASALSTGRLRALEWQREEERK